LRSEDAAPAAFVFPGQGSQAVGMGADCAATFPEAAEVFAAADEVLGFALSELCWNGPAEELQLTANTQPAILTTSIALHRVLAKRGHVPQVVAGHSLGEYSALVVAGCLAFEDAIALVRRRGELMQEAVPLGVGAMAAIIGLDDPAIDSVVAAANGEGSVCAVANLNAPGQTVIAGHREAVERAAASAKEAGAKRAMLLPVSAPFHSPLMAPVRDGMEPYLRDIELHDPQIPVVTNVDAQPATTARAVRDALLRQIDHPVRWVESVAFMCTNLGVRSFVEIGPGRVLSGLIRRISRDVSTRSLSSVQSVQEFVGSV